MEVYKECCQSLWPTRSKCRNRFVGCLYIKSYIGQKRNNEKCKEGHGDS